MSDCRDVLSGLMRETQILDDCRGVHRGCRMTIGRAASFSNFARQLNAAAAILWTRAGLPATLLRVVKAKISEDARHNQCRVHHTGGCDSQDG